MWWTNPKRIGRAQSLPFLPPPRAPHRDGEYLHKPVGQDILHPNGLYFADFYAQISF